MTPTYSIILPIFNEEICLPRVLEEIISVFEGKTDLFEIICVDDCSTDSTWSIISKFNSEHLNIKGIRFLRNFGQQLAVYAGIKYCCGQYIAIMDSDGQDPPELLPELFQKCKEGYDVVYAVRKQRKENFLKRMSYKIFYQMVSRMVPFDIPLDSGDFSVFTKDVADFMRGLKERHPFIRGLRSWYGGKQIGITYDRPKRIGGSPKYTFRKLLCLAINGMISFSRVPLRAISLLGIGVSFLSFFYGLYLFFLKITVGINLLGWTSMTLLIIFFGGLNLFVVGIIGEYIGDIFEEVKGRPVFLVKQTLGVEKD